MWQRRLLNQRGSAPVESVFAISLVLFLALGIIQVALMLYARNVVMASAHEGARAAVELGRSLEEAELVAGDAISDAVGGLTADIDVEVEAVALEEQDRFEVIVRASLKDVGIIPLPITVTARASSSRPSLTR
jgi:Flp pilus assembly protein TadG